MAELRFDGRNAAAFPPYLNPNIFFQSTFDDPTPAIPTKNVPIFILASVKNAGKSPTINANVKFFVCDPSTVPTPTNSQLVGTSNVSLDAGETKTVLCVSAWTPQWVNEGHECVICEASASNDPAPPHPNAGWNLQDRHNVQRNVTIVFAPPQSFALLTPMAASGRFFDATATLSIRRAPDSLFMPTLQLFGVRKCTNVSKESSSGLVKDYVAGAPAPKKGEERIELRGLLPNAAQGFHALVRLPEKDRDDTAAFFLVEQHDKKGQLVGGVGVLVIGGARPRIQPAPAAPPSIPVSVPSRPYATSVTSGMMNLDGIFVSNVGRQLINAETLNQGSETLFGLSMYVEGIADPLVTTPLTVSSPLNGRVFPQASFKSVFLADFTKARTGETMVSFIFQQQSGAESKTTRVLKKIFVMGLSFNRATKTFEAKLPQGSLYVHLDRVIAPKPPRLGGGGTHGNGKCCCCCGGGESDGPETDPTLGNHVPYPVFIKSGTLLLVPSPHYDGTHGPLPFNDPWWKLVLAVIAAILVAAGAIVEGVSEDGGTVGAEGTFEETDPSVHCCTGASVPESTSNGVVAGLIAAGAAVATIAAASDDADWHDRGQEATPPNEVEITTSEYVKFEIDYTQTPTPGVPFNGKVTWNYERNLDSGRTLRHAKRDDIFSNIHYLKSYRVSINGNISDDRHYTHNRKRCLIIGAQFVKPNGSLFKGSQLYVWALLVSNRGTRTAVELRDDGFGFFAVRPQSETKGLLITSQKLPSPVGRPWLVSESGAVALPSSGSFATTDPAAFPSPDPKPNVGTYVGVPSAVARYQGPTTWYMFVFAQDVNTVPQGTDPREAAKTIGGMLLTNNYVIGFNDDPCELNYDAVVTVV